MRLTLHAVSVPSRSHSIVAALCVVGMAILFAGCARPKPLACSACIPPVVIIETSHGEFELTLWDDKAPVTVSNFLAYVDSGFYDDLIRLAGGENAYREETLRFPALSAEGLVRLDPDVIIEMIPDLSPEDDRPGLLARWQEIPGLRAASQNQVHIVGGDYAVVPGPRFIELLEEMGEIINQIED